MYMYVYTYTCTYMYVHYVRIWWANCMYSPQILNEKVHFTMRLKEQASCRFKENGQDATFDLSCRFKIMSTSNCALLGTELLTQVTELSHVVYSTEYFHYLEFMY